MKNTKRILAMLLCMLLVFSTAACGTPKATEGTQTPAASETPAATPEASPSNGLFTPGTYTGVGTGIGGDVEVEVTFSADKIESIVVGEHKETEGLSDPAIEKIPQAIMDAQGLKIDAVAGVTMTSNAILAAVADCVAQAGGDVEALKQKGLDASVLEDETIDTDVVVVGAGIAGISAAIEAADAGAKVVLLEKMGAVGGASITCGGEILAAGTQMQKDQGIEDSADALASYWIGENTDHLNEDMLRFIAENSSDNIEWLQQNGVEFRGVTFSWNYPAQSPLRNHKTADGTGAGFILPLMERVKSKGVEVRLETPAISLINENGTIKGVVAENAGRKVTVNAKSVILATGGYANSKELMAEYAPAIGASGTFLGAAHDGDGLIMARDAGAQIVAGGGAIANPYDHGPTQFGDAGGVFLNVTPEGKRFSNEADYWFKRSAMVYFDLQTNYYYGIMDSKTQNEGFEAAIAAGTAFKADTIEELASQLGMEGSVLKATVDRYNEMCKKGVDEDFGKPARGGVGVMEQVMEERDLLVAVDAAPYYAVLFPTKSVTGTFGGPKVTVDGEVLHTNGDTIPGLYAAGEVANGELLYRVYPCSGSSIQMSLRMGRQAGIAAAKVALGN